VSLRIAVIGTGYVGLVGGACLADYGHTVVCVDKDERKIAQLRMGGIPIYEPGLDQIVHRNVLEERLRFTTDTADAVKDAEVVFIAVGTPSRASDGSADLSYVFAAASEIAEAITGYTVVVNKSTVPVGTGDQVEAIIRKARPGLDFAVASNPEFLREGAAISDFKQPDRVVIGAEDERAREVLVDLYRPLTLTSVPVVVTDRRTAELIKYAANAFLAMKISFINEIADLCETLGADVAQISRGIGLDNRIGPKFLQPGPGYGGFCFPKDTLALARTASDAGRPMELVEATVRVNNRRKASMARKIAAALGGNVQGKKVAFLGLTFKPNTDDMREAPSLVIVPTLQSMGAVVSGYDPQGQEAKQLLTDLELKDTPYDAVEGADAVVVLTEWDQVRGLDLALVKKLMRGSVMVDLRNVYDPVDVEEAGMSYVGIGRPVGKPTVSA